MFWFLWGGQVASNFGDRLYMIAIITFIYKQTDSALLAAIVPFIRWGMQFLSSLLTPLVTQKLSLRNILVLSQFLQSILLLSLIVFLMNVGSSFFFIVTIVLLLSFLHSWVFPLKNAILPELVHTKHLVKANNVFSITDQAFSLFGWLGGGLLISKVGSVSVLWITFVLFLVSSLFFFRICMHSKNVLKKRLLWKYVLDGWKYVGQNPLYRRIFIIEIIQSLAGSVWVGTIILVFVKEVLHKNESWWGYLNGAWLLGTILGGIVFSKWIQKNLKMAILVGLFFNGILVLPYASSSTPLLVLVFAFFIGVPYQVHDIAKRTLLQLNTEREKLAQIFAAYQAVGSISFGIGIFLMNLVVDLYGVQSVYYLASFITLIAAWFAKGICIVRENQ